MQTRKSHRKSRLGCKTCKQRKVKCDERQPTCARCDNSGRVCSYLYVKGPSYLDPTRSSPHTDLRCEASLHASLEPPPRHSPSSAELPSTLDLNDSSSTAESYSLLHFELFQHFKERLCREVAALCPDVSQMFDIALREAFQTPYLMDQILALSASHRSTLSKQDQEWYRNESIRLQTRALSHFPHPQNQQQDKPRSLAPLTFATLLGQHVLFDAFSSTSSLPTILDNLIQCLELHQGIKAVAGHVMLSAPSDFEEHLAGSPMEIDIDKTSGTESQGLKERLKASELPEATLQTYTEAANLLQYLFDMANRSKRHQLVTVQEWLVRVSQEYITLLKQRRPEALVVLAYYGVLLHHAREYWAFRSSGAFLIRAISSHLGDYWLQWLDWPNAQISNEPSRTFWSVMNSP